MVYEILVNTITDKTDDTHKVQELILLEVNEIRFKMVKKYLIDGLKLKNRYQV